MHTASHKFLDSAGCHLILSARVGSGDETRPGGGGGGGQDHVQQLLMVATNGCVFRIVFKLSVKYKLYTCRNCTAPRRYHGY